MKPRVSVLLPVYNGQRFLTESIRSILNQSFKDFELIIIDDGSKDDSLQIIKRFAKDDKRIIFKSRANAGLSATLNEAIGLAKGEYLARQDADDISLPERLEKQVKYMDNTPDVGLVGSNYHAIDAKGAIFHTTNVFTKPGDLRLAQVLSNQFSHGVAMIRKTSLRKVGTYNTHFKIAQDVDLWCRISHDYQIANFVEPLYLWRSVNEGLSTKPENISATKREVSEIREREFEYFRRNRKKYKLFTFHPLSTRNGVLVYLKKKNALFRNMSIMFCQSGLRRYSIPAMLVAWIYAPWVTDTYKQSFYITLSKSGRKKLEARNF